MSEFRSADDLAADFGVDRLTLLEWRRRYSWPHTRIGRKFYFTAEQVEAIKKAHEITGPKVAPIAGQTARSANRRRAS